MLMLIPEVTVNKLELIAGWAIVREGVMNNKVKIDLGSVQLTLLFPLWGRAIETTKQHPMLIDKTAVKIIDQVDYDFDQMAKNFDELSQIAWIQRSLICDQVIRKFLKANPQGTIVNLGCGLDTTFDRVDNGALTWYDLDLPDVIELRKKFISENDRRHFISASLLDNDWFSNIIHVGRILFISAGVLYYFEETEVRGIFMNLLEYFPGSEIFFDVCSPIGLKIANKKVVESSGLDARSHLKWGLKNVKDLLSWDDRIRMMGKHFYFRSPQIGLRNYLLGIFSNMIGIQYMIHLKLG
jgi:O-methyltransferase involved in polyketide biosynthesis